MINFLRGQLAGRVHPNLPCVSWIQDHVLDVFRPGAGRTVSSLDRILCPSPFLMEARFDDSELATAADELIQRFQLDASREAGIFHHLITLPTYHETALGTDVLSEGYFGDLGMLAYVRDIQRREIRRNLASVMHQDLAGSNIGDDHKEYFLGEKALLAGGAANTMNQF